MKKLLISILLFIPQQLHAQAPSITELTINSHGKRMPGLIYQAEGAGPHPTVILLHGYPGNEKNLDVAQALRRKGWNAVFFNYRGAWGAEGKFSFLTAEADVQSVINYLQQPANAGSLRVDATKISLVGHSMGGHMAMAGIFDNPSVRCAVAYDGANLGAKGKGFFSDPETTKLWKDYSDTLFMLEGWSGEKAVEEIREHAQQLDLTRRVGSLNGRPVLLIAADTEVIPMDLHIAPLLKALRKNNDGNTHYSLIDDDHSFSASRPLLIETTASFLKQYCQ
jgi:hypothetical protein